MNMAKRKHAFFGALVQEKEESAKFAFNFLKVIRTFAIKKKKRNFRKFIFFFPKELAQIDSQPLIRYRSLGTYD